MKLARAALLLLAAARAPRADAGFSVVDNLVFAALSDWGGQSELPFTTPGQLSAAAALARVADVQHPKLVVSAGGNFLSQGLPASAEAPQSQTRFAATFENVYSDFSLQVPWYITSGFQDWEGNITAEMAFNGSEASSGRWVYPDLWHTFTVVMPPYDDTVQFVMVDTETLTSEQNQFPGWGNLPNLYYPPPPVNLGRRLTGAAAEAGGADARQGRGSSSSSSRAGSSRNGRRRRLADFDVRQAPPISEAQWAWVEHTISNSTATWLVVIGHDPVWSAGEHGPTWALADRLLPLMEEAGVALYISGRDPIAQHIVASPAGASVDFVGIGNGAAFNSSQAAEMPNEGLCPDGAVAWTYGSSTGFLMVTVTNPTVQVPSAMTVTFYDDTGTVLYTFTKANPRQDKGYSATPTNMRRTLGIMGLLFLAVAACLCAVAGGSYVRTQASKKSFVAARKPRRGASETTPLVLHATSVGAASLSNL